MTSLGTGRDFVTFHLESGEDGGSLLVPTVDAAEVMTRLQRDLSHATFGTSEEIVALYARAPSALRRAPT